VQPSNLIFKQIIKPFFYDGCIYITNANNSQLENCHNKSNYNLLCRFINYTLQYFVV